MGVMRNLTEAATRAAQSYWMGLDQGGFEQPPDLLNGESLLSVNAAGTGTTALIGSNASDQVLIAGDVAVKRIHYAFTIPAANAAANFAGVITPGIALAAHQRE